MAKKAPSPPTTPATDMDHRELRRFAAEIADTALDRLADAYTAAALDLADLTARHDAVQRTLAGVDAGLGEATGADLDAILGKRATAAADVAALAVALGGARRRHTAARLAWLEKVRDLATAEAKAAYEALDATSAASRPDRVRLMAADADYRTKPPPEERRTIQQRIAAAAATARPQKERAERLRQVAGIAKIRIEQIATAERVAA